MYSVLSSLSKEQQSEQLQSEQEDEFSSSEPLDDALASDEEQELSSVC